MEMLFTFISIIMQDLLKVVVAEILDTVHALRFKTHSAVGTWTSWFFS